MDMQCYEVKDKVIKQGSYYLQPLGEKKKSREKLKRFLLML